MNKTISEAFDFVDEVVAVLPMPGVQAFVLPSHTSLAAVRDRLGGASSLLLGAQNAHWDDEGSGATGEVSMRMVADAGARLVQIGHSERRSCFADSDEVVSRKVGAALAGGLTPLVCVGEAAGTRRSGNPSTFVVEQLRSALSRAHADQIHRIVVAYEPVWAIGPGGTPASPDDVAPVLSAIAGALGDWSSRERRGAVVYGGGVDLSNAADLLDVAEGLFVGRAAWDAPGFKALLRISSEWVTRNHPA